MRAHVCGSLATETSVKHCVQFLPSLGETKALVVPGYRNWFSTTSFCPLASIYPQRKHLMWDVDYFHSTGMAVVTDTLVLLLSIKGQEQAHRLPLYPVHIFVLLSLFHKHWLNFVPQFPRSVYPPLSFCSFYLTSHATCVLVVFSASYLFW